MASSEVFRAAAAADDAPVGLDFFISNTLNGHRSHLVIGHTWSLVTHSQCPSGVTSVVKGIFARVGDDNSLPALHFSLLSLAELLWCFSVHFSARAPTIQELRVEESIL